MNGNVRPLEFQMRNKQSSTRCITQSLRKSAMRCGPVGLLALCVVAVMAVTAYAQPLIDTVKSIDTLVINADYVYLGKIIKVRDEPIPGGSEMPGFDFEVEEYLKSPMEEELTPEIKRRGMFVAHPTTKYKDWMQRSCRLLIIDTDSDRYNPTIIELTPGRPDIFTAQFRLLHDPNEIIQAAKAAIERTPSNVLRLRTVRLTVPREICKDTQWENDAGLILEVPADAQLEKWATELIRHADPWNRWEAAKTLRYFKSERNAKLVAQLLNDPMPEVRQAASETLKRWQMDTEAPALRRDESKL